MSFGETHITVIGRLTADPELRTTGNGGRVVNLTIASTARTFNRQSNSWEDGDSRSPQGERGVKYRLLADPGQE